MLFKWLLIKRPGSTSNRAVIRLEKLKKTRDPQYGWLEFWPRFEPGTLPIQIKVNLSLNRPGQAHRVPGGWGSRDFYTIGTWKSQSRQPYAQAAFTSQEIFLVLISVRSWVEPWTTVRPEGLPIKHSIEPASFRLVAQCPKQTRHHVLLGITQIRRNMACGSNFGAYSA